MHAWNNSSIWIETTLVYHNHSLPTEITRCSLKKGSAALLQLLCEDNQDTAQQAA